MKPKVYVDVRRPEEFATGRLPGAVNISIEENPAAVAELVSLAHKNDVVVYCHSNIRSNYISSLLEAKYGVKVGLLDGGLRLYQGKLEV